jgi:hypothetical protein
VAGFVGGLELHVEQVRDVVLPERLGLDDLHDVVALVPLERRVRGSSQALSQARQVVPEPHAVREAVALVELLLVTHESVFVELGDVIRHFVERLVGRPVLFVDLPDDADVVVAAVEVRAVTDHRQVVR